MTGVCDLICTNTSHETPNSGFLAAVAHIYRDQDVVFYSAKSHALVVNSILMSRNAYKENIRYKHVPVFNRNTFLGLLVSMISIGSMLLHMKRKKITRLLCLGTSPLQKYLLKSVIALIFFKNIYCTFVLHGELDGLTGERNLITPLLPEHESRPKKQQAPTPGEKTSQKASLTIAQKLKGKIKRRFENLKDLLRKLDMPISVDCKKSMEYRKGPRFSHIALSGHIVPKLRHYIDVEPLNIHTLTMPALFPEAPGPTKNAHAKFAVFGYGNSGMLQRLNMALAPLNIQNDYEIRIIGMDARGTAPYRHVRQPIARVLTRREMEELAQDIDMFLILYEESRYRLSCSGSIIEAHAYAKPIMYLKNDCVDAFNDMGRSIGIRCADVQDMAKEMQSIIDHYDGFRSQLEEMRSNILQQRQQIDVMNHLDVLKMVLSGDCD